MKNIVVYNSKTGFTKKYATWISEELKCEVVNLKDALKLDLTNKRVIFGGWIFGGVIMGLNKIISLKPVVFAVGSTPIDIIDLNIIKEQNHLENLYYFPGGFDFKKHNFLIRFMLKTLKKSVSKKENKTKQDEYMASNLGKTFDISDKYYIEQLIKDVNKLD